MYIYIFSNRFYIILLGDDMKVKVFDCDHEKDLEESVNGFIADKEIVDI